MTKLGRIAAALGAGTILASPLTAQTNWDSVEVTAEEVAPGIAVLFGRGGNIGVSHGEDATLIIDDQYAPLSEKIEAAIEGLGASPVRYVVNTHWHGDHTGGNEHFGETGATIFAHDNVRIRLAEPQQRGERTIGPSPKEALPVVTYPQGMRFHLNGDTINLMYFGGGHTDGDSVVFWEEDNIVHMGDLYFKIPGFPFIDVASGGNVHNAMRTLDLVIMMIDDETKVIPGHGPMSNKAELAAYRAMIGEAVTRVEASREEGNSLEETIAARLLDDFERGEGFIDADGFVTAIWNSDS
ncbi:putative secreted hydrolase [Erythrobacter sp. NAP1]|uniref:MBL fold metallo-hydrolase n=1 Tax=Erythrobacter sp. NAP1 TaxID=237727 RepID=UPI0000686AC2|nr:MBL fold metallo-hydrolase [Erythrobacter sp. NAP1]EAQ30180.1 putative secreted hydrolase [Erythrobacter sp. NAP1]